MNTFLTMYVSFISPYMALINSQGLGLIISLATWLALGFNVHMQTLFYLCTILSQPLPSFYFMWITLSLLKIVLPTLVIIFLNWILFLRWRILASSITSFPKQNMLRTFSFAPLCMLHCKPYGSPYNYKGSSYGDSTVTSVDPQLYHTAIEIYWVRILLRELYIFLPSCPRIWCDNISAISLASNPIFHARTKCMLTLITTLFGRSFYQKTWMLLMFPLFIKSLTFH